jgi:hypothetical protein
MLRRTVRGGLAGETSEVALKAGDDPLVAGRLGGPAACFGVVTELMDVGELGLDRRGEVTGGGKVRAGLADVGVPPRWLATRQSRTMSNRNNEGRCRELFDTV